MRWFGWLWFSAAVAFPAHAGETTTYTYDALGRLTNVAHAGSINDGLNQAYAHDPADNRTNVTVSGSAFANSTRVVVVPLGGLFLIPIGSGS